MAGSDCTSGSGVTRRGRRSCSSTAGRNPSCAGRGRSPARSPKTSGSSPSTCAATACRRSRWTPSTTATRDCGPTDLNAVIEELELDRPVAGRVVLRRVRRHRLPARVRRGRHRRRRPRRRRGAAHAHASTTSARASSRTPATPVRRTCRPASPPSSASCAPARRSRSARRTGARRCAGTWSSRPRSEGRCSRARSTPMTSCRACRCPSWSPMGAPTRSCCPSMGEHVLEVCPTARASWYDGIGHLPFVEDPARFDRELRELAERDT